jgi:hypothetical protein
MHTNEDERERERESKEYTAKGGKKEGRVKKKSYRDDTRSSINRTHWGERDDCYRGRKNRTDEKVDDKKQENDGVPHTKNSKENSLEAVEGCGRSTTTTTLEAGNPRTRPTNSNKEHVGDTFQLFVEVLEDKVPRSVLGGAKVVVHIVHTRILCRIIAVDHTPLVVTLAQTQSSSTGSQLLSWQIRHRWLLQLYHERQDGRERERERSREHARANKKRRNY